MKFSFKYVESYEVLCLPGVHLNFYNKRRPDAIRIYIEPEGREDNVYKELVKLFRSKKYYIEDPSYSSHYFEVAATSAKEFLNLLIFLKNRYGDKFIIDTFEFNQLLQDLKKNNPTDTHEVMEYKKLVTTSYRIKYREEYAVKNRNYDWAISLARHYLNDSKQDADSATLWLKRAVEYKAAETKVESQFLNQFFASIKTLKSSHVFEASDEVFTALKESKSLKHMQFQGESCSALTEKLSQFLAETKSLETLEIFSVINGERMSFEKLGPIISKLENNTSLKTLNLAGQNLGDDGVIALIEALQKNPRSKIESLNLIDTNITDQGAQKLLEFLDSSQCKIISLKLSGNKIDKSIICGIDRVLLVKRVQLQDKSNIGAPPTTGYEQNHVFVKKAMERTASLAKLSESKPRASRG